MNTRVKKCTSHRVGYVDQIHEELVLSVDEAVGAGEQVVAPADERLACV
jgi:hypothetical protein